MENKKYHIAQFGTFDVESMGDSLFPSAFSFGMKKYCDVCVELFSMNECATPYNNNSYVYSFEQFKKRHESYPFDLVVLGGGEFLHFEPIRFTADGVEKLYASGYLWKEPIRIANELGIRVAINCVGAPHDMTESQQNELKDWLDKADYVAIRDEFSSARLNLAGINHSCVADSLWYMNQMYTKAELDDLRAKLEEQTGKDFLTPYVIVQYGTTKNISVLAQELKKIKLETGYRICLMPINYCHEDRLGAELLSQNGDFEVIDNYFQPKEIISVIAGAQAFFGTSLHGNLTAASYGVKFIGIDMYPSFVSKMDGIFEMLGCEEYLVPNENGIKAAFDAFSNDGNRFEEIFEKINILQKKLDDHFQSIANLLEVEH